MICTVRCKSLLAFLPQASVNCSTCSKLDRQDLGIVVSYSPLIKRQNGVMSMPCDKQRLKGESYSLLSAFPEA